MSTVSSPLDNLRRARGLTAEMLDLAKEGDWDSLPALEDERRHLIDRALTPPIPDGVSDQMTMLLRQILTESQAVVARVAAQRDDLREELGRLGRGRKAMSAYTRPNG